MRSSKIDRTTGELLDAPAAKLNQVTKIETRIGSRVRIQFDYSSCPSMAEQHTAHLTDLNYLIKRYQPDELASYMLARNTYRREILGHDFSQEPNLQEAKNIHYRMKKDFEDLDPEIKKHFKNHVEFLKFIDNPSNQKKMLELGLMTKKEIQAHTQPKNDELNDDKKAKVPPKESPTS